MELGNFPIIIAHRGASHDAPENTLKAFQLAMEQQADGIELDVHLSADGQVVVIHDSHLHRSTNGQGLVEHKYLQELRLLDAGQGEKIPTLAEVLDLVKDQVILNIELKGFSNHLKPLPQAVLDQVADFGLSESILFSSFDPHMLIALQQIDPEVRAGLLLSPGIIIRAIKKIFSPPVHPWSLHPYFRSVNKQFLKQAEEKGQPVFTYTVNRKKDMQRMFSLGVSGIITDVPLLARKVRKEQK